MLFRFSLKLKLARLNEKPSNGIDALILYNPVISPSIHMLLKILCTLPISTAAPEKIFSNFKRWNLFKKHNKRGK